MSRTFRHIRQIKRRKIWEKYFPNGFIGMHWSMKSRDFQREMEQVDRLGWYWGIKKMYRKWWIRKDRHKVKSALKTGQIDRYERRYDKTELD